MKDEHEYKPLPEQEPRNTDESQSIHLRWLAAHYAKHPPRRMAARSADESVEDGVYVDGILCAAFDESKFYAPPVKRPRGRPRKVPLPTPSFQMPA